jgi:hypothetical protein
MDMKMEPRKSDGKPGGELPYKSAGEVVGGPVDGEMEPGLNPDKCVTGEKKLPQNGTTKPLIIE